MKMELLDNNEPKEPYISHEIIEKLVKDLNIPFENWMQDWPYEVVDKNDIEKYLEYYITVNDEGRKFKVMEMLIQSIEEQESEENFIHYWNIVKHLIEKDFLIHEYTIWYWCLFEEIDEDHIEDASKITPFLRNLWYKMKMYKK